MATGDDDEPFDYGSLSEESQQGFLYDVIGFHDTPQDQYAHDMFYIAFYDDDVRMDDRLALMDQMSQYLWDTYGIDFEAIWDWDDFREWYAQTQ